MQDEGEHSGYLWTVSSSSIAIRLLACTVDPYSGVFEGPGRQGCLTTTERALLAYLSCNPHRTIQRDELHVEVWGHSPQVVSRVADVTMRRLRAKLELDARQPRHLLTVHGEGYRFEPLTPSLAASEPISVPTLPPPTGPLIGRARALSAARIKLLPGAVITLVGPAGVGKTRLALELARSAPRALWVDLDDASGPKALALAIASVLGLVVGDRDANLAVQQALEGLGADGLWVVLDRCEHLAEQRETLERWTSTLSSITWLSTSQAPWGLAREVKLRLPTLEPKEAAQLFIERSRAHDLVFEPDTDAIVDLVRRLEGMPLSVVIAASRAQVLAPAEMVRRLDSSLALLKTTVGPARHHSLRAALEVTWALLASDLQRALAMCTVFRGGFTLAAAEQVVGEDALDLLHRLVDHSLVMPRPVGSRVRFHLLRAVREVASSKLQSALEVRLRHAEWAASLNHYWVGHAVSEGVATAVQQESANLLQAFEFAAEQGNSQLAARCAHAWWQSHMHTGPLEACERVLSRAVALHPPRAHRVRLLWARAAARVRRGNSTPDQAQADTKEALRLGDMLTDEERAALLLIHADAGMHGGKAVGAIDEVRRQALECARRSGDTLSLVRCLAALARSRLDRAPDDALHMLQEALALLGPDDRSSTALHLRATLAIALNRTGRSAQATALSLHNREIYLERGNHDAALRALINAAMSSDRMGDFEGSERYFEQAVAEAEPLGASGLARLARAGIGVAAWNRGDIERALSVLPAVVARARRRSATRVELHALLALAGAQSADGRWARAGRSLERARVLADLTEQPDRQRLAALQSALLAVRVGDPAKAAVWLSRGQAIDGAVTDDAAALACGVRALLAVLVGDLPQPDDVCGAKGSRDVSVRTAVLTLDKLDASDASPPG